MKEEKRDERAKIWFRTSKKKLQKLGMSATLGATVVTSMFMKNKIAKNTHIIAGVAFLRFALWHAMLYQPKIKKENEKTL